MLDKFLFGNKHIPEMYFGNIPVAKIYFGNKLIWEKEGYVPYDSTCKLIIDGDSNTQKFSVKVMKNGEDVTSSLDHYTDFSYIVNDVLPSYRITNQLVSGKNEITISDLINKYKETEQVTDSRYDNTKGKFSYDGCRVYSKAGGSFLDTGTVSTLHNITIPYTLTEDYSTNDLWIVVSQNVNKTPVEIKTLQVATTYVGEGSTSIHIFHESGLLVYKYDSNWYTPSSIQKTISGQTYNYLTIDLTALSTGTFKLKRFEKYYIKIKHANNNNNHYYYRNGGILGIVGYVTGNINLPNNTYNLNSLTYEGIKTSETDFLDKVNTNNHYAKYTGTSNIFSTNNIYKCKSSFVFRGVTDNDALLLAANDGEIGYYNGSGSEMNIPTGPIKKSGAAIRVTTTNTMSDIYGESDSTKIFKYTGNTTANMFVKNRFYSCNTQMTNVTEINSEPETNNVAVDDIFFVTTTFHYTHSSGWENNTGFYKVTQVNTYTYTTVQDVSYVSGNGKYRFLEGKWTQETGYVDPGYYEVTNYVSLASMTLTKIDEPSFTVAKQNQPITDETNNMKAKLTTFYRNDYYEEMYGTDLSNLTINTDHKHEILMGN
jgi:hypothetical protein